MIPLLPIAVGVASVAAMKLVISRVRTLGARSQFDNWVRWKVDGENHDPNGKMRNGTPLLIEAIKENNIRVVHQMLDLGADPNVRDLDSTPALIFAVRHNASTDIIADLLQHTVDVNAMDRKGNSVMFYTGDDFLLQLFRQVGVLASAQNVEGKTAMHYAQSVDAVRVFCDAGVDINYEDKYGRTPLFYIDDVRVAREMILRGADTEHRDNEGNIAPIVQRVEFCLPKSELNSKYDGFLLKVLKEDWSEQIMGDAGYAERLEVVRGYLENGADPNVKVGSGSVNAVFYACKTGRMELVEMICRAGAVLNAIPTWNPLEQCLAQDDLERCRLLLRYGADPRGLVMRAISNKAVACCEALLEYRAGVNEMEWSAALKTKNTMLIRLMCEYGGFELDVETAPTLELKKYAAARANVSIDWEKEFYHLYPGYKYDKTLEYAVRDCDTAAVEFILTRWADPNYLNCNGVPMLVVSVLNNSPEILRLLCEAGADPNRVIGHHSPMFFARSRPKCAEILREFGAREWAKESGR